MLSVSFALSSSCPFGWNKVWFHLMLTFRRLARSPTSKSLTMREKQEESVFQSVVLSSKSALPCNWKLRCSELHFRMNPDVRERRAVDQQKSNTILCELLAALVTVCRSQHRIRCVWSESPWSLLQPSTVDLFYSEFSAPWLFGCCWLRADADGRECTCWRSWPGLHLCSECTRSEFHLVGKSQFRFHEVSQHVFCYALLRLILM